MVLLHTEHSVQEDLLVDEHFVGGSSPIDRGLWGSFTAKNGIQRWAKHYTKQRQVCCDRDPGGLVMAQESFPFSGDIMEWNQNVSLV